MKLREYKFSFGEFDHLYLNFTTCLPFGQIEPARRSIDTYHPWYRYYDIGIQADMYENLDKNIEMVIHGLSKTLSCHFAKQNGIENINVFIESALQEGEKMKIFYKEKKSAKNIARIYLRYLNNGKYLPLLCVYDLEENEIFHADLPQMIDLLALGKIQLSSKKVTIQPRKNIFTEGMKPITYELKKIDHV